MLESFSKLRILEVAEGVAGPACGLLFADLGAQVCKFEPPQGDRTREWGPLAGEGSSAIFEQLNRGKQSLVCDLATDAGRALFEREAASADAVLVQLDPADRAACGIDWRAFAEQHPQLVVCEIDDLGDRGPLSGQPGSELTIQAMSGFTRYLGEVNGTPCRVGYEIAWMAGGMHAFHAIAAALYVRLKTDQGQYVQVCNLRALLSLKTIMFSANSQPDEWNGFHLLGPRWPVDYGWPTKDGQITFDFRHQDREGWVAFCREVGLGHLPDHPDYKDWRSTIYIGDRRHQFGGPYLEVFARMTCAEASGIINRLGGISVKFHNYAELLAHPQVAAVEPFVDVPDAPEGARRQIGLPIRYSDVPQPRQMRRAPRLGEAGGGLAARAGWSSTPRPVRQGGPLAGVRVLDASMGAVGPWAGTLLGQLGADVIKLESPQGDFIRAVMPARHGLSTTYISMNFNKRGIVLDLKKPEDRAHVHRLASQADVFIENFRPGVADRIGVGYAELKALNPRLIYASASGFGNSGPMVKIGATDPHIQPFTGSCSVNGLPGGKPQCWRWYAHFDCFTSAIIVQGVLAALIDLETSGRGRHLPLTMLEASLTLQRVRLAEQLAGSSPTPMGSATSYLVPDQAFQTQDRWVAVSVTSRAQWAGFCDAIGQPGLAIDARFASNPLRLQHRAELIPLLEQIFATRPSTYWLRAMRRAQVPCVTFTSMDDFRYHTHYLENGMLENIDTPHWGQMMMGGIPWRFERTPAHLRPGTLPGEKTEEIIQNLWASTDVKG